MQVSVSDAGKVASRLFGKIGSAGGHKSAARAEISLNTFENEVGELSKISDYITSQ